MMGKGEKKGRRNNWGGAVVEAVTEGLLHNSQVGPPRPLLKVQHSVLNTD